MSTIVIHPQELKGTRFGDIQFEAEDILEFPEGLVGFHDWNHFVVINHKEGSPFRWLQSLEEPKFAMLVVDPFQYFPEYKPRWGVSESQMLGLDENDPFLTYVTVTIPSGQPRDMTLNLSGPIIINPANRRSAQIILPTDSYTTRQRVFPESVSEPEEAAA